VSKARYDGVPPSKIPQNVFKNFWQDFEKNLAKTSKKDDKQNRLTSLEVRRAIKKGGIRHSYDLR
jgi:hypothetical protein